MRAVVVLLLLGGCSLFRPDPTGCDAVADRDAEVERYTAISASALEYARNHEDEIKAARLSAKLKCERARGIIPPGGGVEAPRQPR